MKKIFTTLILLGSTMIITAQTHLEVDGKAKIMDMEKANNADSVVVRLVDGTLAIRDVSTLSEDQVLSISHDTIYLTDGGFVIVNDIDSTNEKISNLTITGDSLSISEGNMTMKVPVDSSNTNEIQSITRTGQTVTLTKGGGSFQDSVNVYTAGVGIDITNNVVSNTGSGTSSPWYLGKDTLDGIVFYIYQGSDGLEHGLIVAKTDTTLTWQSTFSLTNANRSWDGAYNMGLMVNSPAKTYVESLGTEWYLPSIDELIILRHNRYQINKALFDGGFTLLSTFDLYWTSTEYTDQLAWVVWFDHQRTSTTYKNHAYVVRAIRAF
jgi:hypothetical protein